MLQAQRAGGTILAFRPDASRRRLELPGDDAARGVILLFTGVRYERVRDAADDRQDLDAYDPVDDSACS